ncbi:MAG: ABC transporter substrate-binding protein [Flavobacteriales bacterium]|nr:ABC transporter substrate-binding protein [Flavobacteriales bacterium]|tara:strand:- start:772 stop:2355 length:1584 start_codon:yes stop_codon:yes gene_type:complete
MKFRSGFFIIIFFLLSCSEKYDNSNLKIFKYNESNGVSTLDPAFAKDKATIWVTSQIFNSLVKMNEELEVIPSISTSWKISEDGLVYTFFLRKDVFFHDHKFFENGKGRRVVASDFVYSFDRLLSSKLASPGSWVFNNVSSYYSVNDSTLRIHLNQVFPPFLSLLSMQYCSVVPKECADLNEFRSHPIGTGPFQFQYWKEGVKLVLRKNKQYFEKENGINLPYLDAVSITFIKDKQSEFLNFLQGNLDFISGLDPSYTDEVLDKEGLLSQKYNDKFNFKSLPFLNTEYLGFLMDGNSDLSENLYLRKAIHYAIDRQKMLKYLRNNVGVAANHGFIPIGLPSYSKENINSAYNLEQSLRYLELAGFPNGRGLSPIVLNTTSSYLDLCEFVQSELKKIGIDLKIEVNPPSTHRQKMATSKLNFFRGSWMADYPDAENYLSLFYSKNFCPNGPNYTHFYNEEYDRLYEFSISETDVKKRIQIYQRLNKILSEEMPVIPLYYDQIIRFSHNNISGFTVNAQNNLDLTRVKK